MFFNLACINGNPALVAYLLSNGARITIDKFGNTPLHDTAVGGYIECARLLIASECDTIARDNQNMTSADIAESYGHLDFAKELRKFERAVLIIDINIIKYILLKTNFCFQERIKAKIGLRK